MLPANCAGDTTTTDGPETVRRCDRALMQLYRYSCGELASPDESVGYTVESDSVITVAFTSRKRASCSVAW